MNPSMNTLSDAVELLGYTGAALVLLAFSLHSVVALRSVAIASNLTFIAYASVAHLPPVLALHAALLPMNLWRLWQCLHPARAAARHPNPERRL